MITDTSSPRTPASGRRSWLPWAGVLVITAYATLAAVQSLALNPLAAVPGRTRSSANAAPTAPTVGR